jgi:hypothetical protein
MGKLYDNIDSELVEWIARQRVFFVATAPRSPHCHLNLSPKGGDAFRVLGPLDVAFQDLTGSGAETIAHLRENGRIVIMFCAFDGPPKILRLHGQGRVVGPRDSRFAELASHFPDNPGTRSIIHVALTRISDSCGYGVPLLDFRSDRDALDRWAIGKGADGLRAYRAAKNLTSIDGLPAFDEPDGAA